MKKNIWIMNHYATNMFFDEGGRHYNFAKYLKRKGYDPVIFSCNVKHNGRKGEIYFQDEGLWSVHMSDIEVPFVVIRSTGYAGNGVDRILNMLLFAKNLIMSAKQYAKKHGKPDVILASSVHPFTVWAGEKLAAYFHVRCICEIRDLWPETIVAYRLAGESNPIIKLLYRFEKQLYVKANAIIFTMPGGKDYIVEKGWDRGHGGPVDLSKVYFINNGVDLEVFDQNVKEGFSPDEDLDNVHIFKAVYTGSLRKVNHVGALLHVAKCLKEKDGLPIKFLIYGDGNERCELVKEIEDMGLDNVVYKGKVEKRKVPSVLARADLCLLHWIPSPIIRYGISANKMSEYLASGKPLLSNMKTKYDIIDEYRCGLSANINTDEEYADLIEEIYFAPKEKYAEYCEHSRQAAKSFDFCRLTDKLITVIEGIS